MSQDHASALQLGQQSETLSKKKKRKNKKTETGVGVGMENAINKKIDVDVMVHACNPSTLGGKGSLSWGLRPAWQTW